MAPGGGTELPVRPARAAVVVWCGTPPAWRPGIVLAWRRRQNGWEMLLRYRHRPDEDRERWAVFDPEVVIPVTVAHTDLHWWLPEARDGTEF